MTVDVLIPVYKPGKKFSMLISMLNKQSYPINRILIINTEEQYWKKGKIQESKQMEVCHIKRKNLTTEEQGILACLSRRQIL